MVRILNAESENYSDDAAQVLRQIGHVDLEDLTRTQLLDRIKQYDALIVRLGFQVDQDIMDAAPQLKVIVSATTGVDHLDLAYAQQRGITVLTLRGEVDFLRTIPATVEHTLGLMLGLIRRIPWAYASVQRGEWTRDAFKGHDLAGRQLGIIGLGRIGEKVAQIADAFGMTVYAYDPYREVFPRFVQRKATLAALLAEANILSIHVPLNVETTRFIDADAFNHLPPHAYVVNTARGDILAESALLDALTSGRIAGAALDVIPGERNLAERHNSRLIAYARQHDNLLITPHIGGATIESMAMTEVFMAKKLAAFFKG